MLSTIAAATADAGRGDAAGVMGPIVGHDDGEVEPAA
jgi:hypothetical protein